MTTTTATKHTLVFRHIKSDRFVVRALARMVRTKVLTTNLCKVLVIIDSAIDDHQILAQGILPTAEVIVLNKHQDGIAQISAALNNHPAASIQIIAHGSPGNLQLGNNPSC
jgi:hypothetical protein